MSDGQLAGTVVGSVSGVAVLVILIILVFLYRRKAKRAASVHESGNEKDDEDQNQNERAEMPDSAGMRVRPAGAISENRGVLVEAPSEVASDKDEKKHPEDLLHAYSSPRELDSTPLTPVELDASPRPTGEDEKT